MYSSMSPVESEAITSAATAVYGQHVYDKGDVLMIQSSVTNHIRLCREYVAVPGFGNNHWEQALDCWDEDADAASPQHAMYNITTTNEHTLSKSGTVRPYRLFLQQDDADDKIAIQIGRVVVSHYAKGFGSTDGRMVIPYGFAPSLGLTFSINYTNDDQNDPIQYQLLKLTGGDVEYFTGAAWQAAEASIDITGSGTAAQFIDAVTLDTDEDASYQIRLKAKADDASTDTLVTSVGLHETVTAANGFIKLASGGPIYVKCKHRTRVGTIGNAGIVDVTRME